MNSLVSVEEEEVSCDGSLVLNASNISGSSIESENENKLNDSNDTLSDSTDTDNKSPHSVNNLLVCLADSDTVGRSLQDQSCESVDLGLSLHPNVISLEQAFAEASTKSEKDFRGFAVDLECLGLPILLDNDVISLDNNTDLSYDIENLFLSDTESIGSFDGFSESSASSFEGFVQRKYILPVDTAPLKPKRGRPRKSKLSPSLHHNSFESLDNSFHISSPKESPKAINGIDGVREQRQSKEKALIILDRPKLFSQCEWFSPDNDSNNSGYLRRSSSEESFEGFIDVSLDLAQKVPKKEIRNPTNRSVSVDRSWSQHSFNHAVEVEAAVGLSKKKSKLANDSCTNSSQEDLSDFIGYNCDSIGCTINWLESAEIRTQPVPINNGVVYELNEFARKINWEPRYIAIWILRLRGYNVVDISDEDLDQIHLILRRRKALTTIFAGKQLCKSKVNAFDKAEFSLPTIEKLDNEKNSCNQVSLLSKNSDSKRLFGDYSDGLPLLFEDEEKPVSSKPTINKDKRTFFSCRSSRKRSAATVEIDEQNHDSKSIELSPYNYYSDEFQLTSKGSYQAIKKSRGYRSNLQPLSIQSPHTENYPLLRKGSQVQDERHLEKALLSELNESNADINKSPVNISHSKILESEQEHTNSQEVQLNKNLLRGDKSIECNTINERSDDKKDSNSKGWLISECGLLKDTESSKYDSLPISTATNNKKSLSHALRSRSKHRPTNKKNEVIDSYDSKLITNSEEDKQVFDKLKYEMNTLPNRTTSSHQSDDDSIRHSVVTSPTLSDDATNLRKFCNKSLKLKNINPKNINSSDTDFNKSRETKGFKPCQEDAKLLQNDNSNKSLSTDNFNVSSKGRIRKPTVKVQDLYSDKNLILNSSFELESSNTNKTNLINKVSVERGIKNSICKVSNTKSLYCIKPTENIFIDDGNIIGKHCNESGITIKLLNSHERSIKPITNGIVYELYHFFKLRNAKLTTLVHTIYRLKSIPIEKAPIISTMAKIHELVKIIWEEQIYASPNMPYNEFEMGISSSFYTAHIRQASESGKEKKKGKVEHANKTPINDQSDNNEGVNEVTNSSLGNKNRIFDLNATKGQAGKITKGDIVYVYTRWLKKKMEGQLKVFVTDLSNDVENLIMERKVEAMRIPVGALMSSSVKLFEKFRKLSKINMEEAKAYLLEDWIQDILELLNPNQPLKNIIDEDPKLVSNMSPINSNSKQLSNIESDLGIGATNNNNFTSDESIHTAQSNCALFQKVYEVGNPSKANAIEETAMIISKGKTINPFEHDDEKSVKILCEEDNQEIKSKGKSEIREKELKTWESKPAEEYEVEKIVGYRIVKIGDQSVTEFRVRWVGFTSEEDLWVNVNDLQCPDRLTEFWEALNKQRAWKNMSKNSVAQGNPPYIKVLVCDQQNKSHSIAVDKKNESSNLRKEVAESEDIFIPMIASLKPSLIDYQYDEEGPIPKRVRVSKGEILSIFDNWCQENQEKLKTGANILVDVDVLISRVKEFMDSKKVRNFNPNCIYDVCFRMSLMKVKLQDPCKVTEYLSGDVMDLIESSRRHQEFVRIENVNKIKKYKIQAGREYQDDIEKKLKSINKFEKESLLIANYIEEHGMKANFEEMLEEDISCLKKVLSLAIADHEEINSTKTMESLKNKSESTIQELKDCGLKDSTIDELIKIILKST